MQPTRSTLAAADTPDKLSRRRVLLGGATLAAAVCGGSARAGGAEANADFLFVQTAKAMAFDADQNRLTLNGAAR